MGSALLSARRARRGPLAMVVTVALLLVGILLALGALLWWHQERIVFQPPAPPWPGGGTARRIDYRTTDGEHLFGYVVGDPRRSPGTLLAFHGNADLAAWQIPWATELASRTGWSVFLAEYRGYAGASGTPSYEGSAHDARAAYAVVRDSLGVAADRIAFFGHSLGTAIAGELASEMRPAALVLQSPFTSARDMARVIIARPLHALWDVIARVHFDTRERVRSIDAPVWVAHGTNDFIIPVRMGRAVHESARAKGELLIVPKAGHNDVATVGGDAYWSWLARALEAAAQR